MLKTSEIDKLSKSPENLDVGYDLFSFENLEQNEWDYYLPTLTIFWQFGKK